MLSSPISPPLSPRLFRSSLSSLNSHAQSQLGAYSPFIAHSTTRNIPSTGPGSATSSEESRSPIDNSLDSDFASDTMAEFEYNYPHYPFVGYGGTMFGGHIHSQSQSPMENRKRQLPLEISDGIRSSPYMITNGDLPFVSSPLKNELYDNAIQVNNVGDNYTTYLVPQQQHPQTPAQHGYAYSSPESPFLDGAAYYSSPASVSTNTAYTPSAHNHGGASPLLVGTEQGCDPRFVSGGTSPMHIPLRADTSLGAGSAGPVSARTDGGATTGSATSSPLYSAVRFSGVFGPAPAEGGYVYDVDGADADADGDYDDDLRYPSVDAREADDEGDIEGEDEQVREDEDDDDSDYLDRSSARPRVVPSQRGRVSPSEATDTGRLSSTRASRAQRPCAPAPVPVPNLTKKSRGRRVPTHPGVVVASDGVARRTRGYTCRVPGCGKCFARGEHLKRHIRSIHTNEKRMFYSFRIMHIEAQTNSYFG